jgi:hypothetical protein
VDSICDEFEKLFSSLDIEENYKQVPQSEQKNEYIVVQNSVNTEKVILIPISS